MIHVCSHKIILCFRVLLICFCNGTPKRALNFRVTFLFHNSSKMYFLSNNCAFYSLFPPFIYELIILLILTFQFYIIYFVFFY